MSTVTLGVGLGKTCMIKWLGILSEFSRHTRTDHRRKRSCWCYVEADVEGYVGRALRYWKLAAIEVGFLSWLQTCFPKILVSAWISSDPRPFVEIFEVL